MRDPESYRYPGFSPFADTELDRLLFTGREKESGALLRMILAERLVVLFGKSGMGKTSLLEASIFHELRKRHYLPISVRFSDLQRSPTEQIIDTLKSIPEMEVLTTGLPGHETTLWHYLKTVEFWTNGDKLLTPVLVFDQFEEFFRFYSEELRRSFRTQLAALVRGYVPQEQQQVLVYQDDVAFLNTAPEVKVVLSIREDYLAYLDELATHIPTILRNRFRLTALSLKQARRAIEEPALLESEHIRLPRFNYAPEVVDDMLEFLIGERRDVTRVGAVEIEPYQLQLLCKHIEEKVVKPDTADAEREVVIDAKVLGGKQGMRNVLTRYYHKILQDFQRLRLGPGPSDKQGLAGLIRRRPQFPRRAIRNLCEAGLIDGRGRRRMLSETDIEDEYKVPKDLLSALVAHRLLRTRELRGITYYELSHDNLVKPIQESAEERRRRRSLFTTVVAFVLVLGMASVFIMSLHARNRYKSGVDAYHGGKFEDAVGYFDQAVKWSIIKWGFSGVDLHNNRGIALSKLEKYEAAHKDFNHAIALDSFDAELYYNRGTAFAEQKEYEEAIDDFEQALELEYNLTIIFLYNNRGYAYLRQGQYEAAIKDFDVALALNPKNADAYNNRGFSYLKQNNLPKAFFDLYRSRTYDDKNPLVYVNWACYYAVKGEPEKAIEHLRIAIEEKDFTDFEWLEQEETLDSIRDNAAYKQLVER